MPRLSIIVPVYNNEKYLHRCINSVLSQTFKDFELILIDDGSTDDCGKICDEYAEKDQRITVIHQRNQGVSSARNQGLEIAAGNYITFVDSDDAVEVTAYEKMLARASETDVDIVSCGVQYYSEEGQYNRSDLLEEYSCTQTEMLESMFDLPNRLGGSCCNKIFLRSRIEEIRFDRYTSMGEDWLFLFEAFTRSSGLFKMGDPFYWVTEDSNSSARKKDLSVPMRILKTSKRMLKLAKRYSYELGCKATYKYLDDCVRYSKQIKRIGVETKEPYRFKRIRCSISFLSVFLSAVLLRKLSKEAIHRFAYEFVRL